MKAIVKSVEYGIVTVRVRRNDKDETVFNAHFDVKVGDAIEVKRQVNNPYLVRVQEGS